MLDPVVRVPTRRLALVVLALAPIWLLSGSAMGLAVASGLTVVLFGAIVADAIFSPRTGGLDVERAAPAAVPLGEEAAGSYLLRSRWPGALECRLLDAPPPGVERTFNAPPRLRIEPLAHASIPFVLTGRLRGVHRLGVIAVRVKAPLGLLERTLRYAPDDTVTVAPSLAGVRRYRLLALQHRLRDAGIRNIRRRGQGTFFANLREYTVGDDPRHIDWKATARRRALVTREYTIEQGQTVLIAVDAGRMMTQLSDGVPRFEHALSSALVLADVALHSGDHVGLIVFDDEVRVFVPPARGRLALQTMREALVPIVASSAEPDYAAAFRTLAARHRKRSLLVLFTDAIDVRSSQTLLAHTARGAAHHLPLVVALRNEALVSAALPRTPDLFERAAAEELLSARDEALRRMRQAGVSVVDVSPRAMTAAVVNRYLEIKARSGL